MSRRAEERDSTRSRGRPEGLPKRWSARRKADVVLRLLRGEDIGEVSREIRVTPPELERWRREFLEGGQQGLKARNRPGGELMFKPSTCPKNRDRYTRNDPVMRSLNDPPCVHKPGHGARLTTACCLLACPS